MTSKSPVERVVEALVSAGYALLPETVAIVGVPFSFDAILVGTNRSFDLVVVADTVTTSDRALSQRVGAITRALDVARSRRSLTVVTVGPPLAPNTANQIGQVARLLAVPADGAKGLNLGDALSVLFPLAISGSAQDFTDPFESVDRWVNETETRAPLIPITESSTIGASSVTSALASFLQQALNKAEEAQP